MKLDLNHYRSFDYIFFSLPTGGGKSREKALEEHIGVKDNWVEFLDENEASLLKALDGQDIEIDILSGIIRFAKKERSHTGILRQRKDEYYDRKVFPRDINDIYLQASRYLGEEIRPSDTLSEILRGRILGNIGRLLLPGEYSIETDDYYNLHPSDLNPKIIRVENEYLEPGSVYGMSNMIPSQFASHFVKYISELSETAALSLGLNDNLFAGDNSDSGLFWTLAPYVHNHLIESGVGVTEAVRQIINWSNPEVFRTYKESIPININKIPYLGWADRGPSHLLANICAKPVADNIYQSLQAS